MGKQDSYDADDAEYESARQDAQQLANGREPRP